MEEGYGAERVRASRGEMRVAEAAQCPIEGRGLLWPIQAALKSPATMERLVRANCCRAAGRLVWRMDLVSICWRRYCVGLTVCPWVWSQACVLSQSLFEPMDSPVVGHGEYTPMS